MKFPRLGRKALTGTPEVVEALRDRRATFIAPLGGGPNGELIQAAFMRGQSATYGWLYANRPAVRMVVDYIASNVAQLPLRLFERLADDEDSRRDNDHPAAVTMRYPTGQYRADATTARRFICGLVTDYLVYDRACILKFRQDGVGPLVLQRLPPTMVLPAGGRFTTDFYRVFRWDGHWFDVPPEDMIHWHGYNPNDALVGLSRLETLRDSLTEDAVSQTTTLELLKNGLKGGHIERPLEAPEWTEEAMNRFRETWANARSGSPRLDPLLEDGMIWKPTAFSPKDAELLAGRQWTVDEVAAVYNFPTDLLRRAAGPGGHAGELLEARKQFYTDTLPPLTEDLTAQLDQDILLQEYSAPDYYFTLDLNAKLRGDPIARYAAFTSAVGGPWMLRSEARNLEDLPAIDGADELITPLNVQVGDDPLPAPNVMPPQDPNGPPQDGTNPTAPTQQTPKPKTLTKAMTQVASDEGGKIGLGFISKALEPTPVAVNQAALKAANAEVTDVLHRLYRRMAAAVRKRKFKHDRFERELTTDLMVFASVPRAEVEAVVHDFVAVVWQSVQGQTPAKVFAVAQERAPKMAEFLVSALAPDGRVGERAAESDLHPALASTEKLEKLRLLRETLNVPDEFLWALAGFSEDEIDQMRAMQNTAALLASTAGD